MHSLLTTTTAYYVENDACMLNQIINVLPFRLRSANSTSEKSDFLIVNCFSHNSKKISISDIIAVVKVVKINKY